MFEKQKIEPVIIAETDNIESAKSLVKMGQGVIFRKLPQMNGWVVVVY